MADISKIKLPDANEYYLKDTNAYHLALNNTDNLLPNNTDLNNVKSVGNYYVLSSSSVSTITNRPVTTGSAFRLDVVLAAGTIRPRQIFQEFNSYKKYMRYETSSGTWADWKCVEDNLSAYSKIFIDSSGYISIEYPATGGGN